jgi:hypothetical protein
MITVYFLSSPNPGRGLGLPLPTYEGHYIRRKARVRRVHNSSLPTPHTYQSVHRTTELGESLANIGHFPTISPHSPTAVHLVISIANNFCFGISPIHGDGASFYRPVFSPRLDSDLRDLSVIYISFGI